jgi:hypothetical protein
MQEAVSSNASVFFGSMFSGKTSVNQYFATAKTSAYTKVSFVAKIDSSTRSKSTLAAQPKMPRRWISKKG